MAQPIQAQSSTAEGYWKIAYDSLEDSLRASFERTKTGKNDILASVLRTANDKREICAHKEWKARLPNGEVIILRDVVEKIAKWVKVFIAVGDVAVQYDPATAALPWAAVRFILQAAINDTQIEGTMVSNLEIVSRLLARYKEFEKIHLTGESLVKQQLSEGLVLLYASLLKFLATSVRYFEGNKLGKLSWSMKYPIA
jgi:hypothetical protein